jgi:hypothetical protein
MDFLWSSEKDALLRQQRGFGFMDVVVAIENGGLLADWPNLRPGYEHQGQFIVAMGDVVLVVPYVQDGEDLFLKTAFPSRVARRKYLGG